MLSHICFTMRNYQFILFVNFACFLQIYRCSPVIWSVETNKIPLMNSTIAVSHLPLPSTGADSQDLIFPILYIHHKKRNNQKLKLTFNLFQKYVICRYIHYILLLVFDNDGNIDWQIIPQVCKCWPATYGWMCWHNS